VFLCLYSRVARVVHVQTATGPLIAQKAVFVQRPEQSAAAVNPTTSRDIDLGSGPGSVTGAVTVSLPRSDDCGSTF
jgi:hypothetical protein